MKINPKFFVQWCNQMGTVWKLTLFERLELLNKWSHPKFENSYSSVFVFNKSFICIELVLTCGINSWKVSFSKLFWSDCITLYEMWSETTCNIKFTWNSTCRQVLKVYDWVEADCYDQYIFVHYQFFVKKERKKITLIFEL